MKDMSDIRGKGAAMAIGEIIAQVRAEAGVTQEQMARKLFVTRQAVSRWETGETSPGIDMLKLISATFGVPILRLLEMPSEGEGGFCQSCGMPFYKEEFHGTEADGSRSAQYCSWCYEKGAYTSDETMDEMVERCAPYMAQGCNMTEEEAISFMGALYPHLKRWSGDEVAG